MGCVNMAMRFTARGSEHIDACVSPCLVLHADCAEAMTRRLVKAKLKISAWQMRAQPKPRQACCVAGGVGNRQAQPASSAVIAIINNK